MKISFFQAGVIAVFILLAGIGLFTFSTFTSSSGKSAIGAVTIWGTFPAGQVTAALAQLANTDKDLKTVKYVQMQAATFDDDYINAVADGTGPDLVIISQEDLERLQPTLQEIPYSSISAAQFAKTFVPGASIFTDSNGTYGIPIAVDPLMLYLNTTLLTTAGIAPATLESAGMWDALTGLVPSVTQEGSNDSIAQALIALGTYGNVHDARGILSALFLQAGVAITTPTTIGLQGSLGNTSSTDGVSPGQAAVDFYASFANPAQTSYTWNSSLPDSQQYFVQGKLALYLGYASELPYLQQANPNLSFTMAGIPQETPASKVDYAQFYAFAIPRASANPSGAFTTAVTLAQGADAAALAKAMGTVAPAEQSLLSAADPSDPYASTVNAEALISKGWLSPPPATTDAIFAAMIQSVITGQSSLQQALSTAEQSLTAALQHPS